MSTQLDYHQLETLKKAIDNVNLFAEGIDPHGSVGGGLRILDGLVSAVWIQANEARNGETVTLTDDKIASIATSIPAALSALSADVDSAYNNQMARASSPPMWSFGTSLGLNAPSTTIHTLNLVKAGHIKGALTRVDEALKPLQAAAQSAMGR